MNYLDQSAFLRDKKTQDDRIAALTTRVSTAETDIVTLENNIGGTAGDPIKCVLYRNAAQEIANTTYTPVEWDGVVSDNDLIWAVGDPTKLYCKTAGVYSITATVQFDINATGARVARLFKVSGETTTYIGIVRMATVATYAIYTNISAGGVSLAVGDYITLDVWQSSGDVLDISVNSGYTRISMTANHGEKGDTGAKGDKGDTGATGAQGVQGEQGDPFIYADFTPEQLAALTGPQGEQGIQGTQGIQGIQGIQGVAGTDAPEVEIEYSANGSDWHSTYDSADIYAHFSTDGGSTWGDTVRIRGLDGEGAGDVLGPATNTDSKFPQWNGANSKTLKDGYTLSDLMLEMHPVGCIYTSVVSTSPATLFGGTWSAFGAGKVLVGLDSGDTAFDTVEETGGEKTHQLTVSEMPAHAHQNRFGNGAGTLTTAQITTNLATFGVTQTVQSLGGDGAHNNLQPYIVVYMWKRTA